MSDVPDRIWIDWKRANDAFLAYCEPGDAPYHDCPDSYVSANLFDISIRKLEALLDATLKDRAKGFDERDAELERLRAQIGTIERETLERAAVAVTNWHSCDGNCIRALIKEESK